jgi:hypothetical protein
MADQTPIPIPRRKLELWTFTQRRTLLGLCIALGVFLAIQAWRQPVILTDPPADSAARSQSIQDKIDPNTATAAELAAIPNLGEVRARAIVVYRDSALRTSPAKPVFATPRDLLYVKGIGVGMEANLEPFLMFGGKPSRPVENPPR